MSFKKDLKGTSLFLFLGICLILTGLYFYRQPSRVSLISPTLSNSPTPDTALAKVTKIIDGDTIVIDTGAHVRYIGINTPEIESSECYASQAAKINSDLVLGKEIRLEKDVSETDKYGRLLRYVYLNDDFVNNELVKNGSARVEAVKPDMKYESEFVTSEKFAEVNDLGLWGKCF